MASEQIIVDRDKWENLVALAKAVGSFYNADEPEEGEAARRRAYAEYDKFCDWRHEEPYVSGDYVAVELHKLEELASMFAETDTERERLQGAVDRSIDRVREMRDENADLEQQLAQAQAAVNSTLDQMTAMEAEQAAMRALLEEAANYLDVEGYLKERDKIHAFLAAHPAPAPLEAEDDDE